MYTCHNLEYESPWVYEMTHVRAQEYILHIKCVYKHNILTAVSKIKLYTLPIH